ncbi:hypothetical protein [Actinorugispora endophytica]|uniref:Uncharacterized protein n=1 Tax=Actinorugispora endophytica TaxID=1605990 RepID=A0A4V3D932_9ACTN|nr:hypothetical protein [Actinorugispora endophytica]TDQ54339.1 hypothetical protein EV190_102173 [Actinorugispora endophytica]
MGRDEEKKDSDGRGARRPPRDRPGPDGPSVRDVLRERYFPEARGASGRTRLRAWAVSVALALLVGGGGFAGTYTYDLWSTEARVREERAAEAGMDQERAPFTSSVTYDTSLSDDFRIVLDRPLTPEEGEALEATPAAEVWDLLRPLGGRLIRGFGGMSASPPGGWSWEQPEGATGEAGATVFTMTLLSTRSTQLSIVDMTPVNISCAEPTATTVVEYPPAGQASYPGVVVDLNHRDPALYISDEGPDQGQPYFSRRRIDLGGGLEPGGLRVEALVRGRSCEWEIRARYVDALQNTDEVVLRDGDRPFFSEAPPERPEQHWLAGYAFGDSGGRTFVPCHETPDEPPCAPW